MILSDQILTDLGSRMIQPFSKNKYKIEHRLLMEELYKLKRELLSFSVRDDDPKEQFLDFLVDYEIAATRREIRLCPTC